MTNQEILEKAIKKAIDGGWSPDESDSIGYELKHLGINGTDIVIDWFMLVEGHARRIADRRTFDLHRLIFNHDFAKALWGNAPYYVGAYETRGDDEGNPKPGGYEDAWIIDEWQFRLQQMVIADDPIKYLGDHM